MTSDEAEAHAWLDERFWSNLRHSCTKFLWLPKRNAHTGRLMWLCDAVEATSWWIVGGLKPGFEMEHTEVRWYKPKDFTILSLRYAR